MFPAPAAWVPLCGILLIYSSLVGGNQGHQTATAVFHECGLQLEVKSLVSLSGRLSASPAMRPGVCGHPGGRNPLGPQVALETGKYGEVLPNPSLTKGHFETLVTRRGVPWPGYDHQARNPVLYIDSAGSCGSSLEAQKERRSYQFDHRLLVACSHIIVGWILTGGKIFSTQKQRLGDANDTVRRAHKTLVQLACLRAKWERNIRGDLDAPTERSDIPRGGYATPCTRTLASFREGSLVGVGGDLYYVKPLPTSVSRLQLALESVAFVVIPLATSRTRSQILDNHSGFSHLPLGEGSIPWAIASLDTYTSAMASRLGGIPQLKKMVPEPFLEVVPQTLDFVFYLERQESGRRDPGVNSVILAQSFRCVCWCPIANPKRPVPLGGIAWERVRTHCSFPAAPAHYVEWGVVAKGPIDTPLSSFLYGEVL
jgi:hypothetical protein